MPTYDEIREYEIRRLLSIAQSDGLTDYTRADAEAHVDTSDRVRVRQALADGRDLAAEANEIYKTTGRVIYNPVELLD